MRKRLFALGLGLASVLGLQQAVAAEDPVDVYQVRFEVLLDDDVVAIPTATTIDGSGSVTFRPDGSDQEMRLRFEVQPFEDGAVSAANRSTRAQAGRARLVATLHTRDTATLDGRSASTRPVWSLLASTSSFVSMNGSPSSTYTAPVVAPALVRAVELKGSVRRRSMSSDGLSRLSRCETVSNERAGPTVAALGEEEWTCYTDCGMKCTFTGPNGGCCGDEYNCPGGGCCAGGRVITSQ